MASVRKRTWISPTGEKFGWIVDYRDGAGKRHTKQFKRKKDADAWLVGASWQVSQGTHTADSQSITVSKAAELWLTRCEREGLERSTREAYEQHVRLHIEPVCGSRKLSQITRPIAEGFRDRFVERLSRAMAVRVLRSLTAIVSEAQRQGYVAQNVCAGIRLKRAPREKGRVTIPAKRDLRMILEAAHAGSEPMGLALTTMIIFAGLRASELRGLGWHNIDLKAATITVDRRADFKNLLGPPKSKAGYRTIPIPSLAVRALMTWKLQCRSSDDGLVFPSVKGKVMSYVVLSRRVFNPIQIAAGVSAQRKTKDGELVLRPRFTLHDFRHGAAALWIDQRISPKRIQLWMGHSSIQVTFDTYGHLFAQADGDATVVETIQEDVLGTVTATYMQHRC